MKVPRLVATCVAVALLAPSAAAAATQEEIDQSVAEGVAWMRTQQNITTGQITGFGGDYALSALAAAGVHAADVGTPSAQDFYAGLWAGQTAASSTAILFGHAAGLDVQRLSESTNLVALIAAAYNRGGELDGSFGNGATNLNAFTALALARVGAPSGRAREGQRLPARPAAPRRRLGRRPCQHRRAARRGGQRRHDRRRARRAVRDRGGGERSRRARRPVVPRGPAGPGHRRLRQRRLDRLGAVRPQRLRGRPAGRALHHLGEPDAGRPPALPAGRRAARSCSPERRTSTRPRTPCAPWPARPSRPTRRGAPPRPTRASAPCRPSPTARRRRTCWRSTTAPGTCACAA